MNNDHRISVLVHNFTYNECKPEGLLKFTPVRTSGVPPALTVPAQPPLVLPPQCHSPEPLSGQPPAPDNLMLGYVDADQGRAQHKLGSALHRAPQTRNHWCRVWERARAVLTTFSTLQSRAAPADLSMHPRSCSDFWHIHLAATSFSGVQASSLLCAQVILSRIPSPPMLQMG